MEVADILEEINRVIIAANNIPQLESGISSVEQQIIELEHILQRSFPISPFHLHHFWIDLRRQSEDRDFEVVM